jgi:two-component system, LytTR family, response regulator
MNAVIIDDEFQSRVVIRTEIQVLFPEISIIGEADGVSSGVELINEVKPDLVFLDIHLGDGTGFHVLDKAEHRKSKVIFITAYDQYAIKAFKYSAIDYLLKPVDTEELKLAVNRVLTEKNHQMDSELVQNFIRNSLSTQGRRIAIPLAEGINLYHTDEIIRLQAESNYTQIWLQGKEKILAAKTLKEFEEILAESGFERVHHSHLVNIKHIRKYVNREGGYLVMSDASQVPVSQRKKSYLISRLEEM